MSGMQRASSSSKRDRERDRDDSVRKRRDDHKQKVRSITVGAEMEMDNKRSPQVEALSLVNKHAGKIKKATNQFISKKARVGEKIRGEHLSRLVASTGLSTIQVQALATEFTSRVPEGRMTLEMFKRELLFDKNDNFGLRLFYVLSSGADELLMDDFITGISRFAPRAKLDAKINICYDLFDLDKSGEVSRDEFVEVTTYSLRLAKLGVSEEKLKQVIDAEWAALDEDGSGAVSREEFQHHMAKNKEFVNSLTIHVPWIQSALRKSETKGARRFLDTEPMINILSDVAVAAGAKPDEADKWCAVLKENFFSDVASLRELTHNDWVVMKLPVRLFSVLQQKLDNKSASDNAVNNTVARKVFKMQHNLKFLLKRKKLQIIWAIIYFLGVIGLLIWTFFKYMTPAIGEKYYGAYQLLSPSLIVSRVFGAMLKLHMSLMLLPVCYKTLTWMRTTKFDHYVPIDSLMFFHRYVGAALLIFGLGHTAAHFVNFYNLSRASVEDINNVFGDGFVTSTPTYAELLATRTCVTGLLMILSMLIMVPLAHEKIRRARFNLFFSMHHLYILIYVCAVCHDGWLYGQVEIIYWFIPSLILFLADRFLSILRSFRSYEILPGTQRHNGDVLELRMEKPAWFDYSAGHYTWIKCPKNSVWEWHPFTLTSSPDQNYISVHINLVGDWTKGMGDLLVPKNSKKDRDEEDMEAQRFFQRICIDGPYGTASGDIMMYSHVILVGGGIGVTPFVSMLKSLAHSIRFENSCPIQGVHFIWVAKSQENFEWFVPLLSDMLEHEDLRGFFKVSIYLTGTRYAINDIRLLGTSMLIKRAKVLLGEDLVTGLEASTTFGRPDFQKILLQANQEWAGNKVGVFFCGPAPLATSIKLTCEAVNKANRSKKTGASFAFKQEFF